MEQFFQLDKNFFAHCKRYAAMVQTQQERMELNEPKFGKWLSMSIRTSDKLL